MLRSTTTASVKIGRGDWRDPNEIKAEAGRFGWDQDMVSVEFARE